MHVNGIIEKPEAGKRKRKGLLICGMHRSGTSLTAGIMCQIGAASPATLMEANEYNETDYWESNVFCKLNDRILSEAGSAWHDILPINPSFFESIDTENHISAICAAIESEFVDDALICVKDPRIARIFPLWLASFQRLKIEPLVIIPIRNPLDVAASLKRSNDFSLSYAQLLWLRYVLDCERYTRGTKRSFVSYEGLLTDWRGCVTNIAHELGIAWPKYQPRSVSQVERMVSERYRHYDSSPVDLSEHAHVSSVVKSVSHALFDATSGNRSDPQEPLTTASIQLSAADLLYAELLAEREIERDVERGAAAALRKEADEQKAARIAAEKALSEARVVATKTEEALQSDLAQNHKNLAAAKAQNALLEQKVSAAKTERDKASAQVSELTKKLDQALANADKHEKEAQALREERETLKRDLTNLTEKHVVRVRELAQMTQILQDSDDQLDALRNRLSRYQMSAAMAVGRAITGLVGLSAAKVPTDAELITVSQSLSETQLFDPEYYRRRYPDVVEAKIDPVLHYLVHGAGEGRTPFDLEKITEETDKEIDDV